MSCGELPPVGCGKMGGVPIVLVHGGAIDTVTQPLYKIQDGVKLAARSGYNILLKTHSVLNAVEAAVNVLEADPVFNAGCGSALNLNCGIEMEACIMEGTCTTSGSVALVNSICYPITLARKVMEKSDCAFLAGTGTRMFAEKMRMKTIDEDNLKTPEMIKALEEFKHCKEQRKMPVLKGCQDTVGAVVVDWQGHVATGCSSGGRTGKYVGRIGDSCIPGAGLFCDDNIGGVVCTGNGESIIQYNLAHRILSNMKNGMSPEDATIRELCCLGRKYGQSAGAVTLNNRGDVGIGFTTETMAWACQQSNELHFGYLPGQHIVELLQPLPC